MKIDFDKMIEDAKRATERDAARLVRRRALREKLEKCGPDPDTLKAALLELLSEAD